jgi:hypothetical protein
LRKPALPIPGVPINITEKRETILTSFNQAFESPLHDAQPILPQGRQAKGGLYLKQKRPVKRMAKNYYLPKTSHHTQKSEAKGREASSPRNTSCLSKATQPL